METELNSTPSSSLSTSSTAVDATRDSTEDIADYIVDELRDQYPWMDVDAIARVADVCKRAITATIYAEEPKMDAARSRCSSMSLSPELRNQVYEFLVIDSRGNAIDINRRTRWSSSTYLFSAKQPPITCVSKQIRSESLPVYYGMNTFAIDAEVEFSANLTIEDSAEFALAHEWVGSEYKVPTMSTGLQWLEGIGEKNWAMVRKINLGPRVPRYGEEVDEMMKGNITAAFRKRGVTDEAQVAIQFNTHSEEEDVES